MPDENFFISYAHADAEQFARRLHDELEGDGFQAWLDDRDIHAPDPWAQSIERGLHDSIGVLVLLTPASIASTVCQNELSMAHTLKKPLIPVLIMPETPTTPSLEHGKIPLVLQGIQYIDFTDTFEQGIAKLRPTLHRILALRRKMDATQQKITDLEQKRPDAPRPQALERAIEDLQGDISNQQSAMLEPEVFSANYRRATETEIESIRQSRKRAQEESARSTRRRVVGTLPQGLTESFKDRSDERGKIVNVLLNTGDDKRVVSIIGRGGVGKTALACNVLHDLEKDHANVHGIAYLSAAKRANTLSLERIFGSIGAMLGGEAEKAINDIWSNANLTTEIRVERLLDHVREQRCILLFDNIEDALDDGGRITDGDVQTFLDIFLTRHHAARILITSREPLNPADDARHYEYVLPLNEGLPADFAIELLRDLDPQGELGLRGADQAVLQQIAEKTYGIPRALEAVVGLLATDPLLTPSALLADGKLWGKGVTEKLVARAQSRLNADQQLVMQALALFGRPVREAAVRYLLEPLAESSGLDISKTLRQLARGRYITVNRSTGEITIHPLDKEYNYRQLAEPSSNGKPIVIVVLVDWESRAGDYYQQVRGTPADWKTYDDLAPILAEFEHRYRAGDFMAAYYLVNTIGYDYLSLWGYYSKELELRQMLVGKLADEEAEAGNTHVMGSLYSNLAYYRDALRAFEQVLPIVQRIGDRRWEGRLLLIFGDTYWLLQDFTRALEYEQTALELAREFGERADEGEVLYAIGAVYLYQGRVNVALAYFRDALTIDEEVGIERRRSNTLTAISSAREVIGEVAAAHRDAQQALDISRRLNDRNIICVALYQLASINRTEGDYKTALRDYQEALTIAIEIGDRRWHVLVLTYLAGLYPHILSATEAEKHLNAALKLAENIASPETLSYSYRAYAQYYLRTGSFPAALHNLEQARPRTSPDNLTTVIRDLGLVHWRLGNSTEAQAAFNDCLDIAANLLDESPNFHMQKYARGLALTGLALITGDATYLDDARAAYEAGIANCAARGVLDDAIAWLDILAGDSHTGQVAPLRALLTAAHGT